MFSALIHLLILQLLTVNAEVWLKNGTGPFRSGEAGLSLMNWDAVDWKILAAPVPGLATGGMESTGKVPNSGQQCNGGLIRTWVGDEPPAGLKAIFATAGHCVFNHTIDNISLQFNVPASKLTFATNVIYFMHRDGVTATGTRVLVGSVEVSDFALLELNATAKELKAKGLGFLELPGSLQDFSGLSVESFGLHTRFHGLRSYHRSGKILKRAAFILDQRSTMNLMWGHTVSVFQGFSGSAIQSGNTLVCMELGEQPEPIRENVCSRIDFLKNCFTDSGTFAYNPETRSRGCLREYLEGLSRLKKT